MRLRTWFTMSVAAASLGAAGCAGRTAYNLPPAQQLMHPGPGVGGPGPGVIPVGNAMTQGPQTPLPFGPGGTGPVGACPGACSCDAQGTGYAAQQCQYCDEGGCPVDGGGSCPPSGAGAGATSQVQFVGEEGLQVSWDVSGDGAFDSSPLYVPGRQDFPQGAIYRLKLTNIAGRPGAALYPTLEIAPVTSRTDAFLAHATVPVQFTEEDFDQVFSGNFVTKVIYLPDPEFQELALSGVETLVSTRLDPGVDPIAEADRRGSILAILRIGGKDLESSTGGYQAGVVPAAFGSSCDTCGPGGDSYGYSEGMVDGGYSSEVAGPMSAGDGQTPVGAPTAGFAPQAVPPHLIAGMNPQYGMPYTGTPIGLPGPPHIPLGSPAGLRRHVMKNRTRVVLPPPTPQVTISVKQRPGMNYPRPVNKVHIDEVHRAPFRPFGGTVAPLGAGAAARLGAALHGDGGQAIAEDCQ